MYVLGSEVQKKLPWLKICHGVAFMFWRYSHSNQNQLHTRISRWRLKLTLSVPSFLWMCCSVFIVSIPSWNVCYKPCYYNGFHMDAKHLFDLLKEWLLKPFFKFWKFVAPLKGFCHGLGHSWRFFFHLRVRNCLGVIDFMVYNYEARAFHFSTMSNISWTRTPHGHAM